MQTAIEYIEARTARAKMCDGVLQIKLPKHWPESYKNKTVARFLRWGKKQARAASDLPPLSEWDGQEWDLKGFDTYVRELNAETLAVNLRRVQIGSAQRSRLAQANPKNRTLTFSRFAINGMPERALRYLVLHELAHLIEANHSHRFWALVEKFEPNYKRERAIAQAHHARMVHLNQAPATPPAPKVLTPSGIDGHPFGSLFSFVFPSTR